MLYKKCQEAGRGPDGKLASNTLEVHSDASFGPGGERSHQGLLAVWAGGLIQWESKRQSFATLSSSEAEVTSYVDAMCLGDSVAVLVDIFEERRLSPSVVWRFPIRNPGSTQPKRAFEIKASQAGVESTARGSATGGMDTVGTTWARFRTFAGFYDMAEPGDLESLKKIAIWKDWGLKGLAVAVELEKWNLSVEEQKTVSAL